MPDYQTEISQPNLSGLSVSSGPMIDKSQRRANTASALSQVLGLAASAYGKNQAKKKGEVIGGEGETFETAGSVVDKASTELETLLGKNQERVGKDVTQDQAKDLRDSVFDKVLTNQKRLERAVSRGLISSTEAKARIDVLRNEALANPLVAPYQDELDNALFVVTGGSGTTFAKTAAEVEAEITRKGQLEALQETEKQVSGMLLTKVAASRNQALSILAQQQQHEVNMAFYQEKKARRAVTSDEAYAASQTLSTTQAASSYSRIAQWVAEGAKADQIAPLRLAFVQEGEQVKNAIRATATGANGELLVDQTTLRAQLDEVDQRVKEYSSMLDNQSGTKQLVDIMAERTAALEYKNQDIHIEFAKLAPIFYAFRDNQASSGYLWNNALGIEQMQTEWIGSSNPVLRMIARLSPAEARKEVVKVDEKILNAQALTEDEASIAAESLTRKGATAAVKESFSRDPEQTLKNLSETPFRLKGISENLEWVAVAKTPEGKEQVLAIVSGSARRAIVSSFNESSKPRSYTSRGAIVQVTGEEFTVPSTVVVKKKEAVVAPTSGRGSGSKPQPVKDVWEIDTGGVWVSETYKSEVVNAYKLGTKVPSLWEDDFETVDEWVSSLFTRPKK